MKNPVRLENLFKLLLIAVALGWACSEREPGTKPGSVLVTQKVFRAGASAIDIAPTQFPIEVPGGFNARFADSVQDPLRSRCLVLDDGRTRLAIVVVDSLMMSREILDRVKRLAEARTGIPTEQMLISATHTHSAPSVTGGLGSEPDPVYSKSIRTQIVRGIEKAVENLAPARVGWTSVQAEGYVHCRRWIVRPDKIFADPFGKRTVRAMMHPGYQNLEYLAPSGPVDPELSMLSLQSPAGRPIALLANFSMHYFGASPLSADYFGRFARRIEEMIGDNTEPPFVGILSQGTSGDLQWPDFSQAEGSVDIDTYSEGLARIAFEAYQKIQYRDRPALAMAEKTLTLKRRVPDPERLAWALEIVDRMGNRRPRGQRPRSGGGDGLEEIYAREQVLLTEDPSRELKLQALRIGELGIAAIPNEVYGITGLKIKAMSPLEPTFNIELANGAEGYIPPPEQHHLGGYTTWPARSAGLEVQAEPKIVETLLQLFQEVSGMPRRSVSDVRTPYVTAVLVSKPMAYWQLGEFQGPLAVDLMGRHHGTYKEGIAFYLEGAPVSDRTQEGIGRAPQFAGGRVEATIDGLSGSYSVEMWFYNDLPVDLRPVTGFLFSRAAEREPLDSGEHLGVGGREGGMGKLVFYGGEDPDAIITGKTEIRLKTWSHVAMVREGRGIKVYLNGSTTPELSGEVVAKFSSDPTRVCIGGRRDGYAALEGKIDEVGLYDRALTAEEIAGHYAAAKRGN